MPCNCDYMEPSEYEIEHAKIEALLYELKNGTLGPSFSNAHKSKFYNNSN